MKKITSTLLFIVLFVLQSYGQSSAYAINSSAISNEIGAISIGEIFVSGTMPTGILGLSSTLTITGTASIFSTSSLNKDFIVASPNPANQTTSISYKTNVVKIKSIDIYNISGKFIARRKLEHHILDIDDLNPGIYILKIDQRNIIKLIKH